MKIAFTGATGFIGKAAIQHLAKSGHEVTALVRRASSASDLPCKSVVWAADDPNESKSLLRGIDAIVNLAGEPIANKRWTPSIRAAIRESRVRGTQKLVDVLAVLPEFDRPKTLISASAIGIYGERHDEILTEASTAASDFLATVTREWEAAAESAARLGVRVVLLRLGVVLGPGGGALKKMQPVILGSGEQWMSWVHLDDVVRFIPFALENTSVNGPYNLVAPNPVRNADFTRELARVRGIPLVLSVPKFILKTILGEMSQVLLASARVLPKRALDQGFVFSRPQLPSALQ